jgi:hypothetical protein
VSKKKLFGKYGLKSSILHISDNYDSNGMVFIDYEPKWSEGTSWWRRVKKEIAKNTTGNLFHRCEKHYGKEIK